MMSVLSKTRTWIVKAIKHKAMDYDPLKEVVLAKYQNDFNESMSTTGDPISPGLDVWMH